MKGSRIVLVSFFFRNLGPWFRSSEDFRQFFRIRGDIQRRTWIGGFETTFFCLYQHYLICITDCWFPISVVTDSANSHYNSIISTIRKKIEIGPGRIQADPQKEYVIEKTDTKTSHDSILLKKSTCEWQINITPPPSPHSFWLHPASWIDAQRFRCSTTLVH